MLRTWGIEFARRAFFVVAPIAKPTKTSPMRDCTADAWSAKTKMKITGRNENRLMTTSSIGSRNRGKASKSPMYSASRILAFNRSPHNLDEGVFEACRFEGHLTPLPQASLDDREDLLGRTRFKDLGRARPVPGRGLDDHPHPDSGVAFRFLHGPEEYGASLVHDQEVVG